jgi:hypothetical protein
MIKWMALLMLDDPALPVGVRIDDAHPLEHSINTFLLIELTQGTFLS